MKFTEAVEKYMVERRATIKDFIEDWGEEFNVQELIDTLEELDRNGTSTEDGYITYDALLDLFESNDSLVDDIIELFLEESDEDAGLYSFNSGSLKDLDKLKKYLRKRK